MKQSEMPCTFNTPVQFGCPYDCGLCPDHEQHSCLSIVEITDRCNMKCPTCYASSGPNHGRHRTLEEVKKMIDIVVKNEETPDVVQISGGEPTIHPDFFAILDYAKSQPIKHLMVNTNGIRIATEEGFAEKLKHYLPRFEIYLQFDSLRPNVLKNLRNTDATEIRKKALEKLNKLNISTTLVVVVKKGLNDDELGELTQFAIEQPCVRGITFQPVQFAGRNEASDPAKDRIPPTEVRQKIIQQQNIFTEKDLIPVPCNPDALIMAYGIKSHGKVSPLTRYIDPAKLLDASSNTIVFERDEKLKQKLTELFSTGNSPEGSAKTFESLLCCLPKIMAPKNLKYENVFRILVMHFQDAYDFDIRAIKKSCVHIVHKDGRIIPFETMNLFYRDNEELLQSLQKEDHSFSF